MAERPLVSIGIPTRNRGPALREALQDILRQDYEPLDILISDNASEDDTEGICRDVAAADARVRYVRHGRNIGLHGNHNFCFDQARGEFLCICHDHDQRDRGIVSRYVAFMQAHRDVGLVCSDWNLINDADEIVAARDSGAPEVVSGLDYISQTVRSGRSSVGIPGAMIRREALGGARFVEEAPIGFGDFPIWFRVAERWNIGHVPERLWSWRQNSVSHSARPITAIVDDYVQNLSAYFDEHLTRWPAHGALVASWRASMKRYVFWALMYEIGLHFRRKQFGFQPDANPTLFEIMDYRLSEEEFQHLLGKLTLYRSGIGESLAVAAVCSLIRLRFTRPLAWATHHHHRFGAMLGLR